MTDDTSALPRYHETSDLSPWGVENRLKESAEAGDNQAHVQRLLVEILAQHVATRRYVLLLATIAVLGVVASLICAVIIAVQVTKATDTITSSGQTIGSLYTC